MNEMAEAATNLALISLLWIWWALFSILSTATRKREADDTEQLGHSIRTADATPSTDDERFVDVLQLDPAFSLNAFLDGASQAYETIAVAYAAADIEPLKPLLSHDVLAAFEEAIAERKERGETAEFILIAIDRVDVVDVEVTRDAIEVTLRFHTQVVWAERSTDGTVVAGDPINVVKMREMWTFARPIPITSDAWTIVATGV
ncbi:Tim44/TimA family putative adaptor protein [Mesorhizobium xinjiangense]|uniref:Tim44/TimA family putative adaptor protein n=1 Tax=Mesorhizobium xinjiangense TaxID=2678685 RepID=UPI0012EEC4D8|nr:Tim44/TimA family putative adaptor protein [Mesorhizobium xinjiangense]